MGIKMSKETVKKRLLPKGELTFDLTKETLEPNSLTSCKWMFSHKESDALNGPRCVISKADSTYEYLKT